MLIEWFIDFADDGSVLDVDYTFAIPIVRTVDRSLDEAQSSCRAMDLGTPDVLGVLAPMHSGSFPVAE